jgi:nucleoporin POM152
LTLQPERSGHYKYTFFQISDVNYKKVELKGPSIDQAVHPLATAEFASGQAGTGRNKRILSSCSGDVVDVDVDLRASSCLCENCYAAVDVFMLLYRVQDRGTSKSR